MAATFSWALYISLAGKCVCSSICWEYSIQGSLAPGTFIQMHNSIPHTKSHRHAHLRARCTLHMFANTSHKNTHTRYCMSERFSILTAYVVQTHDTFFRRGRTRTQMNIHVQAQRRGIVFLQAWVLHVQNLKKVARRVRKLSTCFARRHLRITFSRSIFE